MSPDFSFHINHSIPFLQKQGNFNNPNDLLRILNFIFIYQMSFFPVNIGFISTFLFIIVYHLSCNFGQILDRFGQILDKKRRISPPLSKMHLLSFPSPGTLCPAEHDYINPLSLLASCVPGLFLELVVASRLLLPLSQMYV